MPIDKRIMYRQRYGREFSVSSSRISLLSSLHYVSTALDWSHPTLLKTPAHPFSPLLYLYTFFPSPHHVYPSIRLSIQPPLFPFLPPFFTNLNIPSHPIRFLFHFVSFSFHFICLSVYLPTHLLTPLTYSLDPLTPLHSTHSTHSLTHPPTNSTTPPTHSLHSPKKTPQKNSKKKPVKT